MSHGLLYDLHNSLLFFLKQIHYKIFHSAKRKFKLHSLDIQGFFCLLDFMWNQIKGFLKFKIAFICIFRWFNFWLIFSPQNSAQNFRASNFKNPCTDFTQNLSGRKSPIFPQCELHTVWKFHNFFATQILREIIFGTFVNTNTVILTILAALNFEFLGIFYIFLNSKFKAFNIVKTAGFDLLKWAKIDFT